MEMNIIFNEECLQGMNKIPDSSIDLIVTDPPYYIENLKKDMKDQTIRQSGKNNIFCADWDSQFKTLDEFKLFIETLLTQFNRVLKDKAQVYMFCSYHHLDWMIQMIKLRFRYYKFLIWYKPDTMGVFPNQYGCNYEVILWFRKRGDHGKYKCHIGNGQRDVFTINSTLNSYREECGFHPTAKPIKLIRQLIKNGSNTGDLILDPFMGSGTTAVAAKQVNRNYIGFEISQEYINVATKRLSQSILATIESFK